MISDLVLRRRLAKRPIKPSVLESSRTLVGMTSSKEYVFQTPSQVGLFTRVFQYPTVKRLRG